jgi:DNA polymerase III gamma/tau subunit
MKNTNKLALALTLAFASLAAHAQDKGMDIGIRSTTTSPAPAVAFPAATAQPATTPAAKQVVAPVAKQLAVPASVAAKAPVSQPAPVPQSAPSLKSSKATPVTAVRADPVAPKTAPESVPVVAQSSSVGSDTNPFTGKDLSTEQRQRQLENAKMDTDLIQEKLKQANLIADLTYLPLKKRAEVALLPGAAKEVVEAKPRGEAPAPVARKAVKKVKKTTKAEEKPTPAPSAAVPSQPTIIVSGISINGTKASAILETANGVMSAQTGEITPFGQLRVIDNRTISLGGRVLKVQDAMLSRMTISDPVNVAPEKGRSGQAPTMVGAAAEAVRNSPSSIPLPPLPPLPAPPKGMVSLAPSSGR